MARPNYGAAFTKSVVPTKMDFENILGKNDALPEALPVTYTMKADLKQFADYVGKPVALQRNVVMTDTNPAGTHFAGNNPEDFLSFTLNGAPTAFKNATEVPGFDANAFDATVFAGDDYAQTYFFEQKAGAAEGVGTIHVNFGQNVNNTYTVSVKAVITNLSDKQQGNGEDSRYHSVFRTTNTATFVHSIRGESGNDAPRRPQAHTDITVDVDTSNGVNDPRMFNKAAGLSGDVSANPNESLKVPYRFDIGAQVAQVSKGLPDAAKSKIVDKIDHDVFNVTEDNLDKIGIEGDYQGVKLDASHFDLSLDGNGNLVIAPNAAFVDALTAAGKGPKFQEGWYVIITLETHVFDGKEDKELNNSAEYSGIGQEIHFKSESNVETSSFGDELSIRKEVSTNGVDGFGTSIRIPTDQSNSGTFVYQIKLKAHGTFNKLVKDIVDELPAGTEFVSFVNEKGEDVGETASIKLQDSELKATHTKVDGKDKVTIAIGKIKTTETPVLRFRVKIDNLTENVSVVNKVGGAKASITYTDGYPLNILKKDPQAATDAAGITDPNARFTLFEEDGKTVVFDDLRVVDGSIVQADGSAVVVKSVGTYVIQEVVAPTGYVLDETPLQVVVKKSGATKAVTLWNNRALELDLNKVNKLNAAAKITDENARFTLEGPVLANGGANGVLFDDLRVIDNKIVQENGEAIYVDMAGEYTLTEKVAPAGYVRAEAPVKFTVADLAAATAEGKPLAVNFENVPLLPLNLNKVDSVTGDPIVDTTARFSLYNSDPAAEPKPEPLFTDLRLVDGGKIAIDEDGTPVKVDAIGFYWLQEDVAPNGYFLAKDALKFEVVTLEDAAPKVRLENDPRFRLDLKKVDAVSGDVIANDDQALFTLEGVDPEDENGKVTLADDLKIIDGQIVHADGTPVWVDEVGTYWLTENIAPVGYIRERASMEIVVDGSVIANPVDFLNTAGKTYAIGDVVWIDKNRNGRQDGIDVPKKDREQVLPGVTVELYKDGELLDTAVTDENGRYLFDQLGAGEYEIKFVLTEEQAKIYGFTTERADGVENTLHSRADVTTGFTGKIVLDDSNTYLTKDYPFGNVLASEGIDPTWDAGVVVLDWDDNTSEPIDPSDPDDNTSTPIDPANPGTPIVNSLPNTGGTSPLLFVGIAGLLIAAGGALAFWRRRSAKAAI